MVKVELEMRLRVVAVVDVDFDNFVPLRLVVVIVHHAVVFQPAVIAHTHFDGVGKLGRRAGE